MAKLFYAAGRLALGATSAGLITGACEAVYWHAPLGFAALGYGALFATLATVVGPWLIVLASLRPGHKRGPRPTPWARGAFVTVQSFCTLVLVRFILWRDVYTEAPQLRTTALAWGLAAAAGTAVTFTALFCSIAWLWRRRLAARALRGIAAPTSGTKPAWQPGAHPPHTQPSLFGMLGSKRGLSAAPWLPIGAILLAFFVRVQQGISHAAPQASSYTVRLDVPHKPNAASDATSGAPGVLLVIADALRADAIGAFGAPPHRGAPPTPHLDSFAQGARQFDNAVAQASWTKPAIASILTSQHPSGHQTMAKAAVLPATLPTLGQILQQHNVCTSAVVTNYNLARAFGFHRGFDSFEYLAPDRYLGAPPNANRLAAYNLYRLFRERYFAAGRISRTFYQPAQAVNVQAFDLLDRIGPAPFFMWLHYMEPHDPYFDITGRSFARVALPHPSPQDAEALHMAYRDGVTRFDTAFGALWAGLQARGLDRRTLVVVVADHGEEFGEHAGFYHGTSLYEELVHVPLLMRGPGVVPGRTQNLAQQIDLAPTLAAYLHAPVPTSWEGHNLLDTAIAPVSVARLEENHEGNVLSALRGGNLGTRYKYIAANPDNPRGLPQEVVYDLMQDPRETQPLPPELAAAHRATLTAFGQAIQAEARGRNSAPRGQKKQQPLHPADEAELRALGYVE